MNYIRTARVYDKLKKAETAFDPVVMSAPLGYGKTAAVKYFYRRKKVLTLDCVSGKLSEMPPYNEIRQSVVVIENAHRLRDENAYTYIKGLVRQRGIQTLILTRGEFPPYLSAEEMELDFVRINERDFVLNETETALFFKERGVSAEPDVIAEAARLSHGYPYALLSYANRMASGEPFSPALVEAAWYDMYRLWDNTLYNELDEDFRRFALSVCQYDEFSEEMAAFITGNSNVKQVIEYCINNTRHLLFKTNGNYSLRNEVQGFFCWKQDMTYSKNEVTENLNRGALFYETKGNIAKALEYYRRSGNTQSIKRLLIKNAEQHPGSGQYFELKDYYFGLPEDEIEDSPVLMAGMSMLYDIMLDPEKSEEWYRKLEEYRNAPYISREKKREARSRLAYLDIALPHKGTKGILRIMKNTFTLMTSGEIILPEFSVTSNVPSIMNGGLDFCDWSLNDTQIAKFMQKPLEMILGTYGKGLVNISLAESGFEKCSMQPYEVMTRCISGYEAAMHGGRIEIGFAAVGIQARQHISEGQLPSARRVYETFKRAVISSDAEFLLPNMEAFDVWLGLFAGNDESRKSFIEKIPEERNSFCSLNRYRSIIKLRCLIAENRLREPADLAFFLSGYFENYNRYFMQIENDLLTAVILYRLNDEHWHDNLVKALKKAEEYNFVRIISLEGQAVLPLLTKIQTDEISAAFMEKVINETEKTANFYPDYMKYIEKTDITLTSRETQILSMLCSGLSTDEICEKCGITYNGLKKHNKNIYQKLGAKNRAEAERKALQFGLIHRGAAKSGFERR